MVKFLSENQLRLASIHNLQAREETFFISRTTDKKYYLSDISDLPHEELFDLSNQVEYEIIALKVTLEEKKQLIAAGVPDVRTRSLKIKYKYALLFKDAIDIERKQRRKNNVPTDPIKYKQHCKHEKLMKEYELETRRILYDMIIDQIGKEQFIKCRSMAQQLANQTHPNPALSENRHLWEVKKP